MALITQHIITPTTATITSSEVQIRVPTTITTTSALASGESVVLHHSLDGLDAFNIKINNKNIELRNDPTTGYNQTHLTINGPLTITVKKNATSTPIGVVIIYDGDL